MPKQQPQTTRASKETNNVFKVSIKEVKKLGAQSQANKDKQEIKRLNAIIAQKDEEIKKLKALLEKKEKPKVVYQPVASMDVKRFNKINKLFDSVQQDLEKPVPQIQIPYSEQSQTSIQKSKSKMNFKLNLNDSISDLSKLESIHTKRESQLLTDRKFGNLSTDRKFERQKNGIQSIDIGSTSARGINIPPISYRELLNGIAQAHIPNQTPQQSARVKNGLTPSNFYATEEIFEFIENNMNLNESQVLKYKQKVLDESPRP